MAMFENIFLNPNVVYLFLVGGFTLAMMAILTPGTGLIELSAFFSLLLAGYGFYNLPINYWALVVLLVGVFPFIWAVRRSGRTIYLGIAILALVVGSAYIFKGDRWWVPAVNPVLALVTSLLAGGFFWIVARKTLEADAVPLSHSMDNLIGALGEAKSEIHQEGSAQVLGELWAVRSEDPIPEGSVVRVTGRDGFVLEVVGAGESTQASE
jgi:membrane-bound serine protease (ClpP class)